MQPGRTVSVWEEALPLPCCWLCTADPEVGDTGARRGAGGGGGALVGVGGGAGEQSKRGNKKEAIAAKRGEKLQDLGVREALKISRTFITVPKTLILQGKNDKWGLKNNNSGLSEGRVQMLTRQAAWWEYLYLLLSSVALESGTGLGPP